MINNKLRTHQRIISKVLGGLNIFGLLIVASLTGACSDFVEVDLPKNQLSVDVIFNDPATADAALRGIYAEMRTVGLLEGGGGLNLFMGYYTDELVGFSPSTEEFQNHPVQPTNGSLASLWGSTYNQIYAVNAVIEGVDNSANLTSEDKDQFVGEALFIRGYLHLLLTDLFGDVPFVTSTDFIGNSVVSRTSKDVVYDHIISDLTTSLNLLPEEDFSGERIRPYRAVAEAVLARTYLYLEQWELAEATASSVISQFGGLETDLSAVFKKESPSTIWQFIPGEVGENSEEGSIFILRENIGTPDLVLALDMINAFETGDLRKEHWLDSISNDFGTFYFPFKYKERDDTFATNGQNEEIPTSLEYSVQLRLAEQYLIRAEARAYLGNIQGAQGDVNAIRNRAGLGNTAASSLTGLLDAILQERRVELFTEKGHRWFDLKRMGRAREVLEPIKPGWRDTNVLFPIPERELQFNPNLLPQNEGY